MKMECSHRALWRLAIGSVLVLASSGCGAGLVSRPNLVIAGPTLPLPKAGTLPFADLDQFKAMISGLRGRPVVINVWASWCPPCRAEAPLLARASRAYADRVVFIGVVSRDSPSAAGAFIRRYKMDYANVVDVGNRIAPFLGVSGLPTTVVFGSDGRLRASISGGVSDQRLAAQLAEALQK